MSRPARAPGDLTSCPDTDRTLVEGVRDGDSAAFEQVFAAHYQSLYRLAFRYLGARESAEDIVQNVFRRIWLRHADWTPRVSIRAYLVTAARNECLNALRNDDHSRALLSQTSSDSRRPEMGSPPPSADSRIACAELAFAVEEAVLALPSRCREVFLLRWRDGLTVAETARTMGIAVKSVEAHMTRALFTLRDQLKEHLTP
jgi:RNA polymerase sigma-70 factor (ECF subfamily)